MILSNWVTSFLSRKSISAWRPAVAAPNCNNYNTKEQAEQAILGTLMSF
jgi:hypothetical protein